MPPAVAEPAIFDVSTVHVPASPSADPDGAADAVGLQWQSTAVVSIRAPNEWVRRRPQLHRRCFCGRTACVAGLSRAAVRVVQCRLLPIPFELSNLPGQGRCGKQHASCCQLQPLVGMSVCWMLEH